MPRTPSARSALRAVLVGALMSGGLALAAEGAGAREPDSSRVLIAPASGADARASGPRPTTVAPAPSRQFRTATTTPWYRIGYVSFSGCYAWELADFLVIREDGPPGIWPVNGITYESDGFWFRPVRGPWYKVPGLNWVEVQCTNSGIYANRRWYSAPYPVPGWSYEGISTPYPW
jgi:hypothetical protein